MLLIYKSSIYLLTYLLITRAEFQKHIISYEEFDFYATFQVYLSSTIFMNFYF
jgi:hypothetical protein